MQRAQQGFIFNFKSSEHQIVNFTAKEKTHTKILKGIYKLFFMKLFSKIDSARIPALCKNDVYNHKYGIFKVK